MEVDESLDEYKKTFEACGEVIKDKNLFIMTIVTKIMQSMSDLINGLILKKYEDTKSLIGGPKIRKIFDESFTAVLKNVKPDRTPSDIFLYLLNHGGPRPSVFASESVFEKLVNSEIEKLRVPSIECVHNTHDEIKKVIANVVQGQQEFNRYPIMGKKVNFHLKKFLEDRLPIAKELVNELINVELSSINTNHPDFSIENALKIENNLLKNAKIASSFMNIKTESNAEVLFNLIGNYFPIVKKTIQDQVPKIIMYKIINYMKSENVQNELLNNLLNENEVNLLQESEENEHQREYAKAMMQALLVAQEAIEEIKMGV
ncbi:dynamin-1-like protein [Chironomus tepperi]|uniref:dynamin-1-like protein n=1 Tax=Chironomus tepperi TaxID=113505 RepID=UPI00391F3D42